LTASNCLPSGVDDRRDVLPIAGVVIDRLERTCRAVVEGRRLARALSAWAKRFELSEPEFQLLWWLRLTPGVGVDQTTLASRLALSPAQVSASVERLRTGGWIVQRLVPEDRRRRLWQLTAEGQLLLAHMLHHADRLGREFSAVDFAELPSSSRWKEAA
jgi:DNA-binding MarR family transcriptional regulator